MRIFSRGASWRAPSWRALLGTAAACVAVGLASVNGAPARAAGVAAGGPSSARPAATARPGLTAQPAAAYYSAGGELRGVATVSANNAWAVGSTDGAGAEPLMLHWNGKSWSRVTSPGVLRGAGQLSGITVVSAKDAWAVGSTGNSSTGTTHTLLLHWNGAAWSQVTSPGPVANAALYAVTATAKGGWAVGYYYKAPGAAEDYFPLIFRLSGAKWSRVGTKLGGDALLNGVAVTSAGSTWATGSIVGMLDGFLVRWNGKAWVSAASPLSGQYHDLSGIAAGPGGIAFAVGTDSSTRLVPLSMKWTGKTWQKVTVSAPSWSALNTIAFAPGGAAWAAGTTGLTRDNTLVLRWNGKAWTRVASPGTGTILGLGFAAANNGWAVGSNGSKTLIVHWNGKAWSLAARPAGNERKGTALGSLSPQDERLLAAAIGLAQRARDHGNHPFGALLAAPSGDVLCDAENTVVTNGDVTGHAELNLVSKACRALTAGQLATATLYTSTEPCAMCSGAIYWSRIPRVVYALGEDELAVLAGGGGELILQLPSRRVFAAGSPAVDVSGPHLHDAAAAVHEGFWTT